MPTGLWLYSYVALWTLLLIECVVLALLLRLTSQLYRHWIKNDPDWGLPLGALAPKLPGLDVYDRPVPAIVGPRKRVLVFVSPGCKSCRSILDRVPAVARFPDADVVLVVRAREAIARLFVAEGLRLTDKPHFPVFADRDGLLAAQYNVVVAPFVVVLDAAGRVAARGAAITLSELDQLLSQADSTSVALHDPATAVEPGQHASIPVRRT
jgi:hypothetical protein